MDTINRGILAKINSDAQKGRYIILSEEEISEAVGLRADGETVQKACKELYKDGYIDLKYSGGGMFCVAPLKDIEEPLPEPEIKEAESEITVKKTGATWVFFASLIGGALGSIIASFILAVV